MTTTSTRAANLNGSTSSTRPAGGGSHPRLPVARRDKRPALAALAALLVLVGALGSAWAAFRSGDRVDVLVAAREIPVGAEVVAEDFTEARVAADAGSVVSADAVANFVGTHATARIPQGTLVNRTMFTGGDIVPDGAQLVGVVVDITRRTTQQPEPGDVVRLFYVSGSGGQPVGNLSPGDSVVDAARVVQVGAGGGADSTSVSVLLRDADAGRVADLASAGSIAVAVLAPGTKPAVDLVTG